MKNPPILVAVLGFFAALAGFGFLFFGLRALGFDWFGALGDLPALESVGLWGWLAIATGVIWLLVALGLWALQPWARVFAMIMAGVGLLEALVAFLQFPGTGIGFGMALIPGLILWYLSTGEVKEAFGVEPAAPSVSPVPSATEPAPTAMSAEPVAAPAPVAPLGAAMAASGMAASGMAAATEPEPVPVPEPETDEGMMAAAAVTEPDAAPPPAAPEAAPVTPAPSVPSGHRANVEEVEGIGPAYGAKLVAAGVLTTDDLLRSGATRHGRAQLAVSTGISEHLILEWVNNADLMRIPGVGPQYSDLLEAAGVDSPAELAHRNAKNLATTFQEVVAARPGTVRRIPTEAEIEAWIEGARALPKVVEH